MSGDLYQPEPVLIGDIDGPGAHQDHIGIITTLANRRCPDCHHMAGVHRDVPPDIPGRPRYLGKCETRGCRCTLIRLEAAGWTPPGGCAMGCR